MQEPISNPPTPPIQPTPSPTDRPGLGVGEEGQPKPFSLPPEPSTKIPTGGAQGAKPTPMEAAQESPAQAKWSQEEMNAKLGDLRKQLDDAKSVLQSPQANNLTTDHQNALKKVVDKLNKDISRIADHSNAEFNPPAPKKGEGVVGFVTKWIDSAQITLTDTTTFLEGKPTLEPADFLKMQYSMQRASQRAELFASIIGSTVSGLKTLMSTQLG